MKVQFVVFALSCALSCALTLASDAQALSPEVQKYHDAHHGREDQGIGSYLIQNIAEFGKSMYKIGSSKEASDENSTGVSCQDGDLDCGDVDDGKLEDNTETGGGPCQSDKDCGGGPSQGGGTCNLTTTLNVTTGECVCPEKRADVDCSYKRKDGRLAGGLQFICFAGVGGVGNFILERTGAAVGQLLLMLAPLLSICAICFMACGVICGASSDSDEGMLAGLGLGIGCAVCIICTLSCSALAGLIWCIVDGAMILSGDMLDGNGYRTYPL